MEKITGICVVVVMLCVFSGITTADYMQGFVDMEDFAVFAADWQNPADLEDFVLLTECWLTNYTPAPSIAWWEMEETGGTFVSDSTENGYDLVATDGFIISDSVIGSMVGNGFLFDGSGERLTHSTLLDDFPDAITITGWVRPDATGMSDTQSWFSKINADDLGYAINLTFKMGGSIPNVIAASGRSYDGSYVGEYFNCNSDITWTDDTWYHVAFTWDPNGCEIYIDGQSKGSDDMPIMGDLIPDRNAVDLTIGNGGDTVQPLTEPFKGAIDDVRLYDSVLSASDIQSLYDAAPGLVKYDLIVNDGTGGGSYVYNAIVNIAANTPSPGQEFDVWTGDISTVANINDPTTTVTMPAAAVTVTATYRAAPRYTLTVSSGTGSGSYYEGQVANIAADTPPVGYAFDVWAGDTAYIANIDDPTTIATMPPFAINITATYKPLYTLTVGSGTGNGNYAENDIVNIAANSPPAGQIFDAWTGDIATVTDIYDPTTTITMPLQNAAVTATYISVPQYILTVNNGSGDGNYVETSVNAIAADPAPAGQAFDIWTGDNATVANIYDPTTTVTMPAQDVTLTATYKTFPQSFDQTVLLEAEGFDNYGGWVLDQQFMDQMGSPFLLAHGINAPVADATTTVTFPSTGVYDVWVRTRDWTAAWKEPYLDPTSVKYADGIPGQFEVIVNGITLGATFGIEGLQWDWQYGGTVYITNTNATVKLHDLTGFEGRCDAIVFSKDFDSGSPPNNDPGMKLWRREMLGIPETPGDAGQYDLVVVGGGMAGTCAAISAARQGISVALIQDRPVLGGNNSSEVRVGLSGGTNYYPYTQIGNIVTELAPSNRSNRGPASDYEDGKKLAVVQAEPNIDLYLNYRGNEVETDGSTIVALIAESTETGHRLRFEGLTFADCTGDGVIGYMAGADWEMTVTNEGAGTRLGTSNLWQFENTGSAKTFPSCPWALNLSSGGFPTGGLGDWLWESGFYYDQFDYGEYIRDWNFRAAYGAWDALKNKMGGYLYYRPKWQAYISGKRESRRLLGDVILSENDLVTGNDLLNTVVFEDGCVPTGWWIDLHFPRPEYGVDRGFGGDEFIADAYSWWYQRPYWIPYRCLYSRNIDNLFMAGRNISVTHEALGAVRVMKTTGMMGEIVGLAAAVCKEENTTPRGVYTTHLYALQDLMLKQN